MEELVFPIRINKYLAHKKITTRTGADALITQGKVYINGVQATLGTKVIASDQVEVRNQKQDFLYYAYYKAPGIVTTQAQAGEVDILHTTRFPKGVFPVGRLDKDSEGLILMTNDGRVTRELFDGKQNHEKEYLVEVREPVTETFIKQMSRGLEIKLKTGLYKTKPCKATKQDAHTFRIILTEGKNRQIRRMCETLKHNVETLTRIRILHIELGRLKPGEFRALSKSEKTTLTLTLGF